MPSLWSDLSGSTAPVVAAGRSSLQLSDGTLVFIDASSGTFYLKVWPRTGSPTTTATLSYVASSTYPPRVGKDASDNIYVAAPSSEGHVTFQAFTKGTGHSWTAETAQAVAVGYSTGWTTLDQLVWCNTTGGTGGAGHLLLTGWWYSDSDQTSAGAVVADAGALLAGSSPTSSVTDFFNAIPPQSPCVASAPDGFGATEGLVSYSLSNPAVVQAVQWSLSSTGVLTAGFIGSDATATGSAAFITCGRVGAAQWLIVYPKADGSGNFAATYVTGGNFGATGYSTGPANWPAYSSLYDLFVDPTQAGRVWAIAAGTVSGGSLPVYRLSCTLNSSNTPVWSTSVVLDDTLTVYATIGAPVVVVRDPVIATVDWVTAAQTASSPTYAVLGDASVLAATPSSIIVSPANGAYVDPSAATTAPAALVPAWLYVDNDGSTQAAWALRYKVSGAGSYTYWNATTGMGQSTICWNTGGTSSWTPPSGVFSVGSTYNFSVAVQSSYALTGAFPSDSTFVCQTAPSVTITAPSGGTVNTSQPTATYSTTNATGTSVTAYRIMCYPASVATGAFTPGVPGAVWDTGVVTGAPPSGGVLIPTALTNETSFVVCMAVWETGQEQSAWAIGSAFLCAYNLPPTPTLSAASGSDTNGVPAIAITLDEAASTGSGSGGGLGGIVGLGLVGAFIVGGGGGSGGGALPDTGYTVTITYTDANGSGTVRYGDAVPLTPGTPVVVYDYEATPGVTRTYTATVTAVAGGVVVTATPVSASATLSISSWWFIDPITPSSSIPIAVSAATGLQHYNAAVHYPIVDADVVSTPTPPAVISGGVNGQDGQLTIEMTTSAQWQAFRSCVQSGSVKWLIDPFGDGVYAKVGLANPIAGQSGAAHQTTFTQSPTNQPLRSSVVTYIEVSAP